MDSEEGRPPTFEERFAEIRKREEPPTHHLCKCRDCNPLTSLAERQEAWKAAEALLQNGKWGEEDKPTIADTMILADWLLYGPSDNDSGPGGN